MVFVIFFHELPAWAIFFQLSSTRSPAVYPKFFLIGPGGHLWSDRPLRHDILDRMSRLVGPEGGAVAALALVDCSVFVTKISDAPRVRQALKEVGGKGRGESEKF